MNAVRPCIMTGTACALPVLVWSLVTAADALNLLQPASAPMLQAMSALLLLQGMAAAVIVPLVSISNPFRTGLYCSALLLLVPMPVFVLIWLATRLSLMVIVYAQLEIFAAMLLMIVAGRALSLRRIGDRVRPYAMVSLQFSAAVVLWRILSEESAWLV